MTFSKSMAAKKKSTSKKQKNAVYDLTKSENLLRDMNKALIAETDMKGGSSHGAAEWFVAAIKDGQMIVPEDDALLEAVIDNARSRKASKSYLTLPGRMFAFMYSPRTRAKLEYYDFTPLIITLGIHNDNVLAINLHYLDIDLRMELLDKLLRISQSKYGEKMPPKGVGYFRTDYSMLRSIKYVLGLPCVRSYDPMRMIGNPVLIPSNEWGNATALPFENFLKATNEKIHLETRIKVRQFIKALGEE